MKFFHMNIFLLFYLIFYSCHSLGEAPLSAESSQALLLKMEEIKQELEVREQVVNKKKERIEKTERGLHKLNNKHSWKGTAIGSIVAAAVTATPAGALLGGILGGFVGRSDKYSDIEEKISEMEQEIIVSEEDFLTGEEIRLAKFANMKTFTDKDDGAGHFDGFDNDDGSVMLIAESNTPMQATEPARILTNVETDFITTNEIISAVEPLPVSSVSDTDVRKSCYSNTNGSTKKRSRKTMAQCFYMMQ